MYRAPAGCADVQARHRSCDLLRCSGSAPVLSTRVPLAVVLRTRRGNAG